MYLLDLDLDLIVGGAPAAETCLVDEDFTRGRTDLEAMLEELELSRADSAPILDANLNKDLALRQDF